MSPYSIFTYDIPSGKRHADPTEIIQGLRHVTNNRISELMDEAHYLAQIKEEPGHPDYVQHDPSLPDHIQRLDKAWKAHDMLMRACRIVFGLAPFNPETGDGYTQKFCCDLLNEFCSWVNDLQKKSEPT